MNRDDHLCWFHGKLSRENAEELLKCEGKEDGAFLVRESNTASGDYVLTFLHQDEVWHCQIRRHGEDAFFSIDDKVKILHGLDTLVEFYQQAANGLPTKLTEHIRKDLPPNDSRSHGATNLLHRATKENNQTVVSELLKCGYRNVDAKNQDGQTAMHLAALHCDETILRLLLAAGVSVNCKDTSDNMPLHYACRCKPASFVRILLEANANVQGRNLNNGYVPLHEAAKHGNLEVVRELLSANAPLLPRTDSGEFPIDLAKEAAQEEVVAFLESYKPPLASTFKAQWYHGTLSREEAVRAVEAFAATMSKKPPAAKETIDGQEEADGLTPTELPEIDTSGCFLVRFSERSGYVLTLLLNKTVYHFIISQSSKYLYIENGPYLPTLEHLVEHFMRFSDGLPCSLKHPVLPKPKPPLPLFSTMPRARKPKPSLISPMLPLSSHGDTELHSLAKGGVIDKHAQTLTGKKKKDSAASVFHTLRKMGSPKRSTIMDSMNTSLRRMKPKSKARTADEDDGDASVSKATNEDELRKAESLLKNLSFSTDFSKLQPQSKPEGATHEKSPTTPHDEFYNVPRNNTAISADSGTVESVEIENKTEAEVEYFTKSDVTIERERMASQLAPIEGVQSYATNANGYIPTADIRVFLDNRSIFVGGSMTPEALEASAAELREFSINPERLDSMISVGSNESDINRFLNRQQSNSSVVTQCSEAPDHTGAMAAKLSYFIPYDCLELENIIGEGEFGSVYKGVLLQRANYNKGTDDNERRTVAIKTLRDEHCRTNKQEFLREASVMIRLQHHCIVQMIGISKGKTLMMVQEIVPLGSMLNYILEHKTQLNPNYELKLWASQIACGMEYLESHHFVHRDLAARNILLASRNQAKISDFGLSRALGTGNDCYQATKGGKWPIKWYAPESFNNGLFSHASDVWSFGVTLWEMFALGDPPFGDIRGVDAIALIERGERLPLPPLCPQNVYAIMMCCWHYRARDRPTFRYLTDYFARDLDYQNIIELMSTEHIS